MIKVNKTQIHGQERQVKEVSRSETPMSFRPLPLRGLTTIRETKHLTPQNRWPPIPGPQLEDTTFPFRTGKGEP